jgi:hypothetical protein
MVIESPDGGVGTPATQPVEMAARVELVVKQSAQIQSSAKGFAAAAGKGFQIDPTAAATLISSCVDSLNELTALAQHLDTVGQAPKLGQTPGAQVVAPFTQNAATDTAGIRPAIANLQKTLEDMIQGYRKASTNYTETESLVQQHMKMEQMEKQKRIVLSQ